MCGFTPATSPPGARRWRCWPAGSGTPPWSPRRACPPAETERLAAAAAPAALLTDGDDHGPGLVRHADPDLVRRARTAVGPAGRVVVDVAVAIGRTRSEAAARAARDPRFVGAGHPEAGGIFGTFEQAQALVLELARAGADELRVTLADEIDVADLLAQTRALVVGPTRALLDRG